MKFPHDKYTELKLERRNTLQVFITNKCNLHCKGCFARKVMRDTNVHMSIEEYKMIIDKFIEKDGKQINLLGGEPLLHPNLLDILKMNKDHNLKTTIYTNGYFLKNLDDVDLYGAKLRVSIYSGQKSDGKVKNTYNLPPSKQKIDANFMVSASTTIDDILDSSKYLEDNYNCKTFFISSIRELDNPRKEFFDDTDITMPVLKYKELVHQFLDRYEGSMDIHISKRGVFESTTTLPDSKCRFSNQFTKGKIIQCPYDVVNEKFQKDYSFGTRNCQQNNTCLMSKIILRPNKRSLNTE